MYLRLFHFCVFLCVWLRRTLEKGRKKFRLRALNGLNLETLLEMWLWFVKLSFYYEGAVKKDKIHVWFIKNTASSRQ